MTTAKRIWYLLVIRAVQAYNKLLRRKIEAREQ